MSPTSINYNQQGSNGSFFSFTRFVSILKSTILAGFLNKFFDSSLIKMIKGFSLGDSCQVIDTKLEAKFLKILKTKNKNITFG